MRTVTIIRSSVQVTVGKTCVLLKFLSTHFLQLIQWVRKTSSFLLCLRVSYIQDLADKLKVEKVTFRRKSQVLNFFLIRISLGFPTLHPTSAVSSSVSCFGVSYS